MIGSLIVWVIFIGYILYAILFGKKREDEDAKEAAWKQFVESVNSNIHSKKEVSHSETADSEYYSPKEKKKQKSSPSFSPVQFEPKVTSDSRVTSMPEYTGESEEYSSYDSSDERKLSLKADMIPIWEAAGHGKYEIVEQKLSLGADVNEPDGFFGETALHRAAKAGDLKMVKLLLENGAYVYPVDQYGETPLHFAVRGRNPEVIRLLLQHGADPECKDGFGRTPASCARSNKKLSACFEN